VAPRRELFASPRHPYTRALLAAIPQPRPGQGAPPVPLTGEIPSPLDPPSGCAFRTRCALATPRCAEAVPELREAAPEHRVACPLA
jgi:oligopeptide/dipeptide ABC transporter ATP-binding protein